MCVCVCVGVGAEMKGFVALLTLQLCHSLFVRASFLRLESRSPCHASLAGHSHGGNGLRAAPGAEETEARRDAPGGRAVRPRQVGWRLCGSPSPAQLLADPPSWSLKAPFSKIYWRPPGGRQLDEASDQQRDDL